MKTSINQDQIKPKKQLFFQMLSNSRRIRWTEMAQCKYQI